MSNVFTTKAYGSVSTLGSGEQQVELCIPSLKTENASAWGDYDISLNLIIFVLKQEHVSFKSTICTILERFFIFIIIIIITEIFDAVSNI